MKSRVDSPSEGLELLRSLFYTNYTDRAVDVAEHLERLNLTPEQNWERLEYLGFLHYRRGQYGRHAAARRNCSRRHRAAITKAAPILFSGFVTWKNGASPHPRRNSNKP